MGYDYVGTVQNVEDAKKYLSEDLHVGASMFGFSDTYIKTIDADGMGHPVRYIKIGRGLIPSFKDNQKRIDSFVNKLATDIDRGDKVYQIHFVLDHRKMDYNVFVNPKTKQVMTKYNAFLLPAQKPDSFLNYR